MKNVVIILFALFLSAFVAFWVSLEPGTVTIDWLGYQVDTSVMFILIILVFLLLVIASIKHILSFIQDITLRKFFAYRADQKQTVWIALRMLIMNDNEKALKYAEKSNTNNSENSEATFIKAGANLYMSNFKDSIKNFSKLLASPENKAIGLKGLCDVYEKQGIFDKAITLAKEGYNDTFFKSYFAERLIKLYKTKKLYNEALDFYAHSHRAIHKLMKGKRVYSELLNLVAIAYIKEKNDAKAIKMLEESIENHPTIQAIIEFSSLDSNLKDKKVMRKIKFQNTIESAWVYTILINDYDVKLEEPDLEFKKLLRISDAIYYGNIKGSDILNHLPYRTILVLDTIIDNKLPKEFIHKIVEYISLDE